MRCVDCEAEAADHKWGRIKAGEAGWFFTRDGKAYCPSHIPEWVKKWRNNTKQEIMK